MLKFRTRVLAFFLVISTLAVLGLSGCALWTASTASNVVSPPQPENTPASPRTHDGKFADVTGQAGITYRWTIEGKRPLNILQTIGNGCAFLDYNKDGNLDILLVGPKLALYQGDGHGHFTDVTHEAGLDLLSGHFLGCATGDYDNDGFVDLYISAYRGGVLLHNESGKRFLDVTLKAGIASQRWGTSCAFADIDGDGKLDLYIAGYAIFGPETKPQLCEYGGHMSACGPRFYQPERGALYHNEGEGRFKDITLASSADKVSGKALGVAFADFDSSGRQSLAIANDETAGDLMFNAGPVFKNIGAGSGIAYDSSGNVHGGMGLDWGDFDNDGKLDLVVATFHHEAKAIYRNDGGTFFTERSATLGIADKTVSKVAFGVKWLDFDNDGWLDLVFANGHVQDNIHDIDPSATYRQSSQLFRNLKGTGFQEVSQEAGSALSKPIVGRGMAVGDFDNDGRVDILIVDSEGAPLLLHNETVNAGHWLSCRLVGRKCNRDAIGAMVTVSVGGRKLVRRCGTDGSYMSASDIRVHFGLGDAKMASISVGWPNGSTSTLADQSVDRVIEIRQ